MATAAPRRRTQAERSASTRARLLEATVACLVESGYAGTTTSAIELRAGVSRGARIHHFRTKAELLAAAVEQLYADITARYAEALERMGPDARDFSVGYRLLWDVYSERTHEAVLEVFVAARTDPELRVALAEVAAPQQRGARDFANQRFPSLATPEARGLLECLQATMLGLTLRQAVFGPTRGDARALDLLESLVTHEFLDDARERKS